MSSNVDMLRLHFVFDGTLTFNRASRNHAREKGCPKASIFNRARRLIDMQNVNDKKSIAIGWGFINNIFRDSSIDTIDGELNGYMCNKKIIMKATYVTKLQTRPLSFAR
jgi:hypothetical protein